MSRPHMTIVFEDAAQDFLEWDLDVAGMVIDSRPYQRQVWAGNTVLNARDIKAGDQVLLWSKWRSRPVVVKHKVKRVRRHNQQRRAA